MTRRNRHRIVWSEDGLRAIRRRDVDLCIWRRGFETAFSGWCQHVTEDLKLDVDEVVNAEERWPVERWLSSMPACEHRAQLAEDVRERVGNYFALLQSPRARVQLACVHTQSCPKFHVDHVSIRLICTWAGPATEWIAERDLEREQVRAGLKDVPTQHLERFDVALMKGAAHPGNGRWGVVHRSPQVLDTPRLVLTIDGRP